MRLRAVLSWVLVIVTAAALPLFAQPADLLQELTHGYSCQGIFIAFLMISK
jgi:hypothetical protein